MLDTLDPISIALGVGIGLLLAIFVQANNGGAAKVIPVNPSIEKDSPKVGHMVTITDMEDLMKSSGKDKVSYCRCWRSEKFPYCDGSHNKYNEKCKDNTGPLTIMKKE